MWKLANIGTIKESIIEKGTWFSKYIKHPVSYATDLRNILHVNVEL